MSKDSIICLFYHEPSQNRFCACRRRGVCPVLVKLHRDVFQSVAALSVLRVVLSYSAVSAVDDTTTSHCQVTKTTTTTTTTTAAAAAATTTTIIVCGR